MAVLRYVIELECSFTFVIRIESRRTVNNFFIDPASRYNRVKKNQPDAQLILSIFRQPVRVSGVSRPIIRRYNRMYTTIGTYYSF